MNEDPSLQIVFFVKKCGIITVLKILQYTVFAILD